jgi:hypothetical protein
MYELEKLVFLYLFIVIKISEPCGAIVMYRAPAPPCDATLCSSGSVTATLDTNNVSLSMFSNVQTSVADPDPDPTKKVRTSETESES